MRIERQVRLLLLANGLCTSLGAVLCIKDGRRRSVTDAHAVVLLRLLRSQTEKLTGLAVNAQHLGID